MIPLEIKCKQCSKISVPTYKDEPLKDNLGEQMIFAPDYVYDLCNDCMSKGWISDTKEVYEAIRNDPALSRVVNVKSPLQFENPEDL